MCIPGMVMMVAAFIGLPLLFGILLRLRLRHLRPDVLALLPSTTFLFRLEQIPVLPEVRMHAMVVRMFGDPFNTFNAWLVAPLFFCIVMARIAIPYLIARCGVWLVDRSGRAGLSCANVRS